MPISYRKGRFHTASAMSSQSEGVPDSCRYAEAVCFPPTGVSVVAIAPRGRKFAAFPLGLLYTAPDFRNKTVA